jgi:hypothetical protein
VVRIAPIEQDGRLLVIVADEPFRTFGQKYDADARARSPIP